MTRDRVRMGIVGTGRIAQNRHLPSYQRNDRVVVVAAADPVPESVHSAAAAFAIPSVYTDYREMLEREDLDAVSVCTPNKYHAPVAIAALRQGLHVFCEKPLVRSSISASTSSTWPYGWPASRVSWRSPASRRSAWARALASTNGGPGSTWRLRSRITPPHSSASRGLGPCSWRSPGRSILLNPRRASPGRAPRAGSTCILSNSTRRSTACW